jgi:hypothetical protein
MIFLFNLPVHSACFWPVRFAGLLSTGGLSRWASGNGGKDAFDRAPKATSEAGTLPITVGKGTSEASGVGTSPNDSPSPLPSPAGRGRIIVRCPQSQNVGAFFTRREFYLTREKIVSSSLPLFTS